MPSHLKARDYEITEELIAKFWASVEKRKRSECWPWLGGTKGAGYGYLYGPGRRCYHASHIAYFIRTGKNITGIARHKCDWGRCANPWHILDGSFKDNTDDMIRRGRAPWQRFTARVDFDKLYNDLKSGATRDEVARRNNISISYLSNLIHGRRAAAKNFEEFREKAKYFSRNTLEKKGVKRKLETMRRAGATYGQIAQELSLPRSTVSWYCRTNDIQSPTRKLRPKLKRP